MKKVTAVQWLINKLITENEVSLKGENYKLFELAKEMEKEQIKEAHLNGQAEWDIQSLGNTQKKLSEQYYNETYKSE
jgi:hypothetical protein